MEVHSRPRERWVEVLLADDCEEARFVYDLMASGRLDEEAGQLPLPFRGSFLFKLPNRPRPVGIRVARLEPTAEEQAKAEEASAPVRLLFSLEQPSRELLEELERALRGLPPAADDELQAGDALPQDEFSRVRAMNHAQRVIYATRAGQGGRAILMQQPNPLLLLYLCKNPLITLPEGDPNHQTPQHRRSGRRVHRKGHALEPQVGHQRGTQGGAVHEPENARGHGPLAA